jgi:hypothetical protein
VQLLYSLINVTNAFHNMCVSLVRKRSDDGSWTRSISKVQGVADHNSRAKNVVALLPFARFIWSRFIGQTFPLN